MTIRYSEKERKSTADDNTKPKVCKIKYCQTEEDKLKTLNKGMSVTKNVNSQKELIKK